MGKNRVQADKNPDENQSINFPTTNWHSICIRQFAKVDDTNRLFCRHWEIRLFAPFLLISLIAFIFTVSVFVIIAYFNKKLIIISLVENAIFLILFLTNYFAAMCMDPGFLPYFWPAIQPLQRKFWYDWEEQLTYLATNSEQFEIAALPPLLDSTDTNILDQIQTPSNDDSEENSSLTQNISQTQLSSQLNEGNNFTDDSIATDEENAKETNNISTVKDTNTDNHNHSKLRFASFSKTSGRFVIRADHICGWISNWVGKRNHKQFILFTLYGGILSVSLLSWRIAAIFINKGLSNKKSSAFKICDIISIVLEVLFIIILVPFCANQINQLSQGKTQIQRMKESDKNNKNNNKKDCMYEMRQVCGEGNIFCWICPTPAFGKDLYIEGYS